MHTWRLRDRVLQLGTRCLVMGILNATPDSFSDGGMFFDTNAAIARGIELVSNGADILDIGGESTRPGSEPVSLEEELRRVVPVVAALAEKTNVPISVDTSKAEVARACLQAGAHIINDVTGLSDPNMVAVAREFTAGVIVMHMQGTPATMQNAPEYDDVVADVVRYLAERVQSLVGQGIVLDTIMIDPGIGFGKRRQHNLTLLARLHEFNAIGRPLCLGVSRKGFVAKTIGTTVTTLAGSLAVGAYGLAKDAVHVLRVHDVAETRDLVAMWDALRNS